MSPRVQKYSGRDGLDIYDWVRHNGTRLNPADVVTRLLDQFGAAKTVTPTNLIELKSSFGLSALRDEQTTVGSATITALDGEFRLRTTAAASDSAQLDTLERGRYVPGLGAEAGVGARLSAAPTGEQEAVWGYMSDDNGLFFGQDATGVFVARRKNSTDNKTYQSSWNVDTLDGSGDANNPSGLTLDTTDGYVYRIDFAWYGYGAIVWKIVFPDDDGFSTAIPIHRTKVDGETSLADPNLPLRGRIENGATATAIDLFVAGRSFAVLGPYAPNVRINGDRRFEQGSIGTTLIPTVSIRIDADEKGTPVRLRGFDIISDADLEVVVLFNGSLTSASWGAPSNTSASETAIETDISATAISGGEVLWRGLVEGGTGAKASFGTQELSGLNLPTQVVTPVTIAVRRISGTNATVSTAVRVKEEW